MANGTNPDQPSVRGVALLTLLTLLALVALTGTVQAGLALVRDRLPPSGLGPMHVAWGFTALLLVQCVYCWFAWQLAARQSNAAAAARYALGLQLQALAEIAALFVAAAIVEIVFYFLIGLLGDHETQAAIRRWANGDDVPVAAYIVALAMPAVALLMGAWRLHHLGRTPQAVAAAVDGSLLRRSIAVGADALDARQVLVRHLERLTDRSMPGLGRLWYGSHPQLRSMDAKGGTTYELTWWQCPMKLLVTLRHLEDHRQEVAVHCVLRGGLYKVELLPTPADALAQMQYAEAHLLAPLRNQLAILSAERQRDALRDQAVETQLRILQAQIEPHFLFNTLANVRHLYRSSTAAGEDMLDHLIAYLRCAMDDLRAQESTIGKEMDLAAHYLSIMQIRMGERLSFSFVVPDALFKHGFPPAMLISLVENAIKHGLPGVERGEIVMSAKAQGDQVRLTVLDNGSGISSVGGTGVGLSNIRQRLEAMYGSRAWLEVGVPQEGGFAATIVIPLQERT